MDGSRQFHLGLPPPPGFSSVRPFDSLGRYTRRYVSRLATGVAATVCLSPLSRYLYDRENVSLALTRTDRKQSVIAPRGKMPTRLCARTVSRGCGEKRRGCFHHYVYVLPDVVTCSRELLGSRMETGNSFFEKFE